MDKTYKFLGISSIICKVLAWVLGIVIVGAGIIVLIGGGTPEAPRVSGLFILLIGLVYFLMLFTASEVISLLLELRNKVNKGSSV